MVAPAEVHATLRRHLLVDGFDLVLDTHASRGSVLIDARDGARHLDVFSFFASSALGMNHPTLTEDADFLATLTEVAVNKPSNSDVYTIHLAAFTETFARVAGDPALPHLFFIDGGALAVENALKGRLRLEVPPQRGARPGTLAGTARASSDPRVPWAHGLHAVADQHRSVQDRPVPDVRLAPRRRPDGALPRWGAPRRGGGGGATGPGAGPVRLRRVPARHRLLRRRPDPSPTACPRTTALTPAPTTRRKTCAATP